MTDEQFKAIINQLENEYNNDVKLWSKITAICKYHKKFNIWDEWSQKSEKYNKFRNIKMWRNSKLNLDINYICKILEIKQIKKILATKAATEAMIAKLQAIIQQQQ